MADGVRRRAAGAAANGQFQVDGDDAADNDAHRRPPDSSSSLLGATHWMLFLIYFVVVYAVCLYLDDRLPAPLSPSSNESPTGFSEERARRYLNALAEMGPRPTGSDAAEVHARNYLLDEIGRIRRDVERRGVFRMDVDVQKPSGCFDLSFLSDFTHCYKNVTNIVVRFGRRSAGGDGKPSPHSLLLNCHFDSVPQSPGATDDAISCAVMLELINVFAADGIDPDSLPYDLIFLFNGAEENFMQASHGFITTHPWRHSIRAFINLEGCGAGGREMLFQSGPANIWLLHAYLDSAPYPHCSIMAQEIFQSGLIPADTDYRIFRDFGRIPGMDIAYMKNGYVYHTEFDHPDFVADGALQRAGENVLATALNIIRSPCFTRPCREQETKLVYFDVMGLFVVQYTARFGALLNYLVVAAIVYRIVAQIRRNSADSGSGSGSAATPGGYSAVEAAEALGVHVIAIVLMAITGFAMTRLTVLLDLTLCWYNRRVMVLILYVVPTMVIGLMVHSLWKRDLKSRSAAVVVGQYAERVTFDMALAMFALCLFALTWVGLGSAYYALIHALFPLARDPIVWIYRKFVLGGEHNQRIPVSMLLLAHSIALFPVMALGSYGALSVLEFFIPIMGRSGPVLNPEILIAFVCTACSVIVVLYMAGMVHVSRSFGYLMKIACGVILLVIAVAAFTEFGAPYSYDPKEPRLRRIHIQHVSRTIYGPDDRLNSSENALFIVTMDYRGVRDLPVTSYLQGSTPPPCVREDDYCGLPYHVSVKDMFPPERALWTVVPSKPVFSEPVTVRMTASEQLASGMVKMHFEITGNDHMTVFVTPINNWILRSWSLTGEVTDRRKTYFLYFGYVGRHNGPWQFSLTLEKDTTSSLPSSSSSSVKNDRKVLLGAASHYFHGPNQFSPLTESMIDTIRHRRSKPLGDWKWFMTPDAHNSEYVAKYF